MQANFNFQSFCGPYCYILLADNANYGWSCFNIIKVFKKMQKQNHQKDDKQKKEEAGSEASGHLQQAAPFQQPQPSVELESSHLDASDQQQEWQSFEEGQQPSQSYEESSVKVEPKKQQQKILDQPKKQQKTLGCDHYLRNCEVEAPCCKIYYTCKLCHDEKYAGPKSNTCHVQRMAFEKVANIRCLNCGKVQEPSLKCTNPQCEITFGQYACLKCKLYQNRPSKVDDIFHCDDCHMCRRGKTQNFFHCHPCGYCRAISEKNNHKCTQNAALSQCPICLEVLKFSVKHYIALPCGHLIHLQCLEGYRDLNCPVCGMATQKMSKFQSQYMEQMIEHTKGNMPKELLDKKVDILCNECLHKSLQQPFHFMGIKCQACGTFNTKMI